MAEAQEHLKQAPGQQMIALDGLVRVGIGPQVDGRADITRLAQLLFEHFGGVGLGDQLGFEIQPRGKVPIRVGGAGIAVDTAVLAASVGVDGAVEGQVGRSIAADDRLGVLDPHFGTLGDRDFLIPAVILRHARARGEAVVRIVRRATALLRCLRFHGLPHYCIYIQYTG
ncbi:hypothetical protein D3C79_852660 [compost metagenome]